MKTKEVKKTTLQQDAARILAKGYKPQKFGDLRDPQNLKYLAEALK